MLIYSELANALSEGNSIKVQDLTAQALQEGTAPDLILNKGLFAGMDIVGAKFKNGDIFIPHVLIAARAMHAGMDILKPHLIRTGAKPAGRFIIGTVQGDHHDIGKNLVAMMLQGKGFEVIDLGVNVPTEIFVQSVRNNDANILGMSALLSTTLSFMKETIDAIKAAGLRDKIKIMVGGGPVTQAFADNIGADGYAQDATKAAENALALIL
jgi:5-methyltetrahydrofolate--homocysteine methyltransferase